MAEAQSENDLLRQENSELRRLLKQVQEQLALAEQKIQQLSEQLAKSKKGQFDNSERILKAFLLLRLEGNQLGFKELLDGLKVANSEFYGREDDTLDETLILVWCKSRGDEARFLEIWKTLKENPDDKPAISDHDDFQSSITDSEIETKPTLEHKATLPKQTDKPDIKNQEDFFAAPLKAPNTPPPSNDRFELKHYYPVSRRFMTYSWRYLRAEEGIGPRDQIDFEATVKESALNGIYLAPILRRRVVNTARLVMLFDHLGSMMPVQHYLRDLLDTAQNESDIQEVDVFYFQNVPTNGLFKTRQLVGYVDLGFVLNSLDEETSVLIVSDAGAARGNNSLDRIYETEEFLAQLYQHTQLVAWLNPMPRERWQDSSAAFISQYVNMFSMNEDGLSNAIEALRGLTIG